MNRAPTTIRAKIRIAVFRTIFPFCVQNHFFHLKMISGTITLIAMTVSAIA